MTRIATLMALLILLLGGCIQKIERPTRIDPTRYFPLNVGDEYIYTGFVRKVVTSNNIDNLFTRSFLDSTGNLTRREDVVFSDNGIRLKAFSLNHKRFLNYILNRLFLIPLGQIWSATPLLFNSVEIRGDSINSHLRAQIKYEIMAIDTVYAPSGEFSDCIQIKMSYRTLDETESKFMDGENIFWYARDVGIVKFITPSESGVLLQATIAGKTSP